MQTIQSSGRTLKASCIPVCLCVPNLRSSLAYQHSSCLGKILCRYNKLSQSTTLSVPILHADHPELPFASETCCMNVFLWSLYMDSFKLGKWLTQSTNVTVLCKSCIAAINVQIILLEYLHLKCLCKKEWKGEYVALPVGHISCPGDFMNLLKLSQVHFNLIFGHANHPELWQDVESKLHNCLPLCTKPEKQPGLQT